MLWEGALEEMNVAGEAADEIGTGDAGAEILGEVVARQVEGENAVTAADLGGRASRLTNVVCVLRPLSTFL